MRKKKENEGESIEMDIANAFDTFFRDIRFTFRQVRRHFLSSSIIVISLALGVGANTAIFSVMNGVLLRSLPVPNAQELVILTNPNESGGWHGLSENARDWISYPEFVQLRDHLTTLSGLCAVESGLEEWQVRIGDGQQETMHGRLVSEDYFSVMGVQPAIGRFFSQQDATGPNQDAYAVISYDFWQNRFGGDSQVLGKVIKLNATVLTVIGVGPRGFKGESMGRTPDIWIPMMMQPAIYPGRDWLHEDPSQSVDKMMWLHAFGRMKPGTSIAKVQSEVNVVFRGMMEAFYPATLPEDVKKQAMSQYLVVRDGRTGAFSRREEITFQLEILLVAAGLVLVIGCANVANLLLVRAAARRRELGVRLSIGASRLRLYKQFFTESLLLAGMGGIIGLILARIAAPVLVHILSDPNRPLDIPIAMDWRVVGYTMGITLLTSLVFGTTPALRASRTDINSSLRESAPNLTTGGGASVAKILVVAQVAFSFVLVMGAGLFLRTLWNLQTISLGYPKDHLLQVRVDGVSAGYKDQSLLTFYRDVGDKLRTLPGISDVAYSRLGLLAGLESQGSIAVDGFTPQHEEDRQAHYDSVSSGYFTVLGVPLAQGRDFGDQDSPGSMKVCVINQELAKHFFHGTNPLGHHMTVPLGDNTETVEIVGVVTDTRSNSLRQQVPRTFYTPLSQVLGPTVRSSVIYEIRTVGDPKSLLPIVRKTILSVNPDAPITFSYTMEELLAKQTRAETQIAGMCLGFAIMALLLAAIGLYGVLSDSVNRRTNEIGIRMALGADRYKVIRMILGETGLLVAIGLGSGMIAAVASSRVIASKLYGVSQMDPLTLVTVLLVLLSVSLTAALAPAIRAARVNPLRALRHE
jgi:predicted permease